VATHYGARVLTDSAEAMGATYAGLPAAWWGDAAVLSFNGNKVMTTSGGGMLLTDDARLAQRARYLATQARQPYEHYEHTDIGYNYRLSNVLAAIGCAQLRRLDEMLARRRRWREMYADAVRGLDGVRILGRPGDDGDNCWLTALVVDRQQAGWSATGLARALAAANIESRPLWKPLHAQPVFAAAPRKLTGVADGLFRDAILLPSSSRMTAEDVERVVGMIGAQVSVAA